MSAHHACVRSLQGVVISHRHSDGFWTLHLADVVHLPISFANGTKHLSVEWLVFLTSGS